LEDSLRILWYAFSAAWLLYLAFVVSLSSRQRQIWEQLRDLRARLDREPGAES
jgi:hypothetical protein